MAPAPLPILIAPPSSARRGNPTAGGRLLGMYPRTASIPGVLDGRSLMSAELKVDELPDTMSCVSALAPLVNDTRDTRRVIAEEGPASRDDADFALCRGVTLSGFRGWAPEGVPNAEKPEAASHLHFYSANVAFGGHLLDPSGAVIGKFGNNPLRERALCFDMALQVGLYAPLLCRLLTSYFLYDAFDAGEHPPLPHLFFILKFALTILD